MALLRGMKLSHILSIILVVTLIYITFQLFIFNKLKNISSSTAVDKNAFYKNKIIQESHAKANILDSNELEKHISKISIDNKINQTLDLLFHFNLIKYNQVQRTDTNFNDLKYVKGVNKNDLKLYQPDTNGQFVCLKSMVIIFNDIFAIK